MIVCRCSNVSTADIGKFRKEFPNMPADQLKSALKIGTGCGCCQKANCPVIDISYEKLIGKYI